MPAAYRLECGRIAPRYLARGFAAEDGLPTAAVDEAERRLDMRMPASLAYYYQRRDDRQERPPQRSDLKK
jgi:hypothetical protein